MRTSTILRAGALFLFLLGTFRFNLSGSMEARLMLKTFQIPRQGDIVLVCLPEEIAQIAHERGYARRKVLSPCESGVVLLKRLVGVPGDVVSLSPDAPPKINHLPHGSLPAQADSLGRTLFPARTTRILRKDECVVLGDHVRSWDSRYFGLVPCKSLQSAREVL